MRCGIGLFGLLAVTLWAPSAMGQRTPAVGSRLPDFPIEDLDGREVRLRSFLGRPVLIFYEDRSTAPWNRALKDRLLAMARRKELPPRLLVLPIVDLRAFRVWPARSIAQAQLRARSRELGKPLWADWSGLAAGALGVSGPGPAVVVLLDARQRVLWFGTGRLGARETQELLALLRSSERWEKGRDARPERPPDSQGSSLPEEPMDADRPDPERVLGAEESAARVSDGGLQGAPVPDGETDGTPHGPRKEPDTLVDDGVPLPPFVIPLGPPPPGRPLLRMPPPMR